MAIAVLVLVVSGVSSAVQTGISSYNFSKNQIIAFYLAQEGVEEIRNKRDTNSLADLNWLAGISSNASDPCYFGKTCRIGLDQVGGGIGYVIEECPGGVDSCPDLRQDEESGLIGYDSNWTPINFRRSITITSINENEISILVIVDWSRGLVQRQFRARENLLNWQ